MNNKNVNRKRFYQKGDQVDFRFYKTPKEFYCHWQYRHLSLGARSLYMVLSDRLGLSLKNQMLDNEGFIFVLFKTKPAQDDTRSFDEKPMEDLSLSELLNVNPKSIRKYKEELIRCDLLFEKRSGQGRVNRLYVLKPNEKPLVSQKLLQLHEESDAFKKNFPALYGEGPREVNITPLYQMSSRG